MIVLPIKKQWFDPIVQGKKKEEYREIKPYYTTRFSSFLKSYAPIHVRLKNGYRKQSPFIDILCTVSIGEGLESWGAEKGKTYYILHIEKIYQTESEEIS